MLTRHRAIDTPINPMIILLNHHRFARGGKARFRADRRRGQSLPSPNKWTGVIVRAFLASTSTDRISHSAILVAGVLCGALVFFVAVPLAVSSPFPAPREGIWVLDRPSIATPLTPPPDLEREIAPDAQLAIPWSFVSLPESGAAARFELASLGEPQATGSIGASSEPAPAPAAQAPTLPKRSAAMMDEVDDYLWEVYQRAPTKRDGSGDFTWKDPAAAKRMGMSMPTYVIGGMDPDFREQLYHAGRAMDAAGIRWSLLSAFRDDYRQSLASGLHASASNSLHGGKARTGGYGHGQAVDVTGADNDNASAVWRWIDAHGAKFGLHRPMPGYDPAHVQPKGSWHKLAATLRETRPRLTQEASAAPANTTAR